MENIVKFPFGASRRAHSRKPRASKNGTPEERAERKARATFPDPVTVQFVAAQKPVVRSRQPRAITGEDWDEFVRLLGHRDSDPDLMQVFMVDARKLFNRFWRKL